MKAHLAPYGRAWYSRGYRAYAAGHDSWARSAAARRVRAASARVARRARKQGT